MNINLKHFGGWRRYCGQRFCLVLILLTGCNNRGNMFTRQTKPAPIPTSEPSAETNPLAYASAEKLSEMAAVLQQQQVVVLQVNFDILRARVPKGAFSESGKIWNHLDEEAVPAEVSTLLQRNGLRVARGKEDSWQPIQAILDQEKLETARSNMTMSNGLPLTIELDQRQRDQTLFLYRRDNTLAGVTCPMSGNRLRIEYEIPVTDASAVVVEVMPEIRQQKVLAPVRVNELGQLDRPIEEPGRVLRELAFRMTVSAGEFFVIGPSRTAHQGYLPGSLLLCEQIEGRTFETMYFITPRVYRTDRTKKQ